MHCEEDNITLKVQRYSFLDLVLNKRQHWQIARNGPSSAEWAEGRYEVLCEPGCTDLTFSSAATTLLAVTPGRADRTIVAGLGGLASLAVRAVCHVSCVRTESGDWPPVTSDIQAPALIQSHLLEVLKVTKKRQCNFQDKRCCYVVMWIKG